jgi:TonB family protein
MKIALVLTLPVLTTALLSSPAFANPILPSASFFAQEPTTQQQAPDQSIVYKVGGDVLPPVLIHSAEPKFAREPDHKVLDDFAVVGLTIDKAGRPTDVHIVKSSDPNYDKVLMKAVSKYRFKPATSHGEPVAVELRVEIKIQH